VINSVAWVPCARR